MNRPAIQRRTLALLYHFRAGDRDAVSSILAELSSPEESGAALASLLELVDEFLGLCDPADVETWLRGRMLELAAAEGGQGSGGAVG